MTLIAALSKSHYISSIISQTASTLSSISSKYLQYKQEPSHFSPYSNYRFYHTITFYVSEIPLISPNSTAFTDNSSNNSSNFSNKSLNFPNNSFNFSVFPYNFSNSSVFSPNSSLLDRLKSNKKPLICPENCCCFSIEKMGRFSLEKSVWMSKCPNRKENMECGYQSHKGKCKNMSISLLEGKVLGKDVGEQVCWGVDLYTRNLIVEMMSKGIQEGKKLDFMQFDLIKALNFQVIR